MKNILLVCLSITATMGEPKLPDFVSIPRLKLPQLDGPLTRATPVIRTFPQRIDHFSWYNTKTFDMRYTENGQFFNGSGPLFVFIAGEAPLEDQMGFIFKSGLTYDMAKKHGAYMVCPEHRFYGDSVPNGNLGTLNLNYLQIRQVLADLAAFITDRKNNVPGLQNSKVVVFGGSYPGSLAAWMRLKYPNVVDAAVSSSGIFNIKVDNYEYNEVVQRTLNNNTGCVDTIHSAFVQMQKMMKTQEGRDQIKQDYPFASGSLLIIPLFQQSFFASLMYHVDTPVQYDFQIPAYNTTTICQQLTANSSTEDAYTRFRNWFNETTSSSSNNNNTSTQEELDANRVWTYQVCTDLGSFVTTTSQNQPFSNTVPVRFWNNVCLIKFGPLINSFRTMYSVGQTNRHYGKAALSKVTKIVYSVGSIDPWSGIGMTADVNSQAPVLHTGSSHCADLLPPTRINSSALADVRTKINTYITSWIQ